jgi:circadian clock protein KaiB
MTAKATSRKKKAADDGNWNLRLYVVGQTAKSVAAIANLKKFCADHLDHLDHPYTIEIIDVAADPKAARRDEIVAIPTLVRNLPAPIRKIIGDLSHTDRVLVSFDLHPRS